MVRKLYVLERSVELWLTETLFHQYFWALDSPSLTSLLFPLNMPFWAEISSFFSCCLHSTHILPELVRRAGYLLAQDLVEF